MNGLFYVGGVIGALVLPTAADKLGRNWAIGISASFCLVSAAVMAGGTHVAEFIVFRFVAGADAAMMLSLFRICHWSMGRLRFSFWTKGAMSTWRPAIAIQAGFSLMELFALFWIPESPRWVVTQDRIFDAICLSGAVGIWFIWPDTRGLPLEEVAAIFGDADEVAIYQQEIEIDHNTNIIINHHSEDEIKKSHDMPLELIPKDMSLDDDNARDHVSYTEDVNIEA
ncbi:hypothetical protein B7463_g10329, partial [Scytalidium lignicola]